MVKKKLLTLDDLVLFCKQNNFTKFSAKESGYQLAVQVPTTFEVEDESDDNHRGMLKLKFRILHDGLNRNGSFVSHEAADKASVTIADRPIMAAIHQLDDGSWDFESHEMEIIENEDGEQEINYIEKQVGSFSSEKPFWEHDDELDKDYLCAYGYIAEEYTKAADIIRNKGWTKNSCELSIEELAYNARENYLELKSFYLSASTLLGKRDDGTEIGEGMLGSRADIADFSVENNSVFSQNEKVIKLLSELNEKIDGLNINIDSKRKEEIMKKEFEENTEEEIKDTPSVENFDGEESGDGTDDGVDYYEDPEDGAEDGNDEATNNGESDSEPSGDDELEPTPNPEPEPSGNDDEGDDEGDDDVVISDDDEDSKKKKKTNEYSVTVSYGEETKTFAVSLQDKIEALYTLVNDTYAEADGCYYDCTVYDEDKYVIMSSWWTGDAYKQSYKVKKDVYSLVGDRIRVKAVYVTEDEEKALENMRANYSAIEEKLAKYESEPAKKEILQSEDWKNIRETKEFAELSKRENYFDLSTDELTDKLDKMLLEYSKHNKIEFSSEEPEKKQIGMKLFGNPSKKATKSSSRYGGLFSK
jgi:hypothetical protein